MLVDSLFHSSDKLSAKVYSVKIRIWPKWRQTIRQTLDRLLHTLAFTTYEVIPKVNLIFSNYEVQVEFAKSLPPRNVHLTKFLISSLILPQFSKTNGSV